LIQRVGDKAIRKTFEVQVTSHVLDKGKSTNENESILYEVHVEHEPTKKQDVTALLEMPKSGGNVSNSVSQDKKNVNPQDRLKIKFQPKKDTLNQEKSPQQEIADKQAVIAKYATASHKMKDE
jgi:hypothetical protein